MYEGSIWEAALFASFHNLKNLVAIIDRNIGSLDHVKNFTKLDPLKKMGIIWLESSRDQWSFF